MVLAKKTRVTAICKQRVGLPQLAITTVKSVPIAGSTNRHYTVSIRNRGPAAAESLPVGIFTDNKSDSALTLVDSIGPGDVYDAQLDGPTCASDGLAMLDPKATLRLPRASRLPRAAVCK